MVKIAFSAGLTAKNDLKQCDDAFIELLCMCLEVMPSSLFEYMLLYTVALWQIYLWRGLQLLYASFHETRQTCSSFWTCTYYWICVCLTGTFDMFIGRKDLLRNINLYRGSTSFMCWPPSEKKKNPPSSKSMIYKFKHVILYSCLNCIHILTFLFF